MWAGRGSSHIRTSSVLLSRRVVSGGTPRANRAAACRCGKHRAHSKIIDLVEVVIVVAEVVGLAADVSHFKNAFPRQPLRHSEAVVLGPRLLGIRRIQCRNVGRCAEALVRQQSRRYVRHNLTAYANIKRPTNNAIRAVLYVLFVVEVVHAVAATQHRLAGTEEVPSETDA